MSGKPFVPCHIDFQIGKTIRVMRARFGLSQKDLANILGVTFQQVQKYESGDNRISAARLYEIAQMLEIPINTLYGEQQNGQIFDNEMMDIVQNIYKMSDADKTLVKTLIARLRK